MRNKIQLLSLIDGTIKALLAVFVFLLPLKFTIPAMLPNAGMFPLSFSEWIFEPWNSSIFPIVSLIFLLLVFIFVFFRKTYSPDSFTLYIPLLWTILGCSALLGFIQATCFDFPILQCAYLFGLSAFATVIFVVFSFFKDIKYSLIKAISLSAIILCLYGLYQYFFGLPETKAYVEKLVESGTIYFSEDVMIRLRDNQIFSTFAVSNNFAGFLILTIPITIYSLVTSNFNETKHLKSFIVLLFSLLLISALILTGSRSAMISLILSLLLLTILCFRMRSSIIFTLSAGFMIGISAIFLLLNKGIPSILVRFDYFQTSLILLKNHIITGSGWGSFLHSYPYMKKYITGEAPNDPHNFLLSIGSQSGIIAMIISFVLLLIPIITSVKNIRQLPTNRKIKSIQFPILIGYAAWFIHSLSDTNFQIPGSISIAIVFSVFLAASYSENINSPTLKYAKIIITFTILISSTAILMLGCKRLLGEYYFSKLNSECFPDKIFYSPSYETDPLQVKNTLEKNLKYMPYSPFPLAAAALYESHKNNNLLLAQNYMEEAIKLSPDRASFYYDLSIIMAKQEKKKETLSCLETAYRLSPYKYKEIYEKVKKFTTNE